MICIIQNPQISEVEIKDTYISSIMIIISIIVIMLADFIIYFISHMKIIYVDDGIKKCLACASSWEVSNSIRQR